MLSGSLVPDDLLEVIRIIDTEKLTQRVRQTIDEYSMFAKGDTVLVAVSGGADSLALLYILEELKDDYGISLHVFHLNHMFRGTASEDDAIFVKNIADKLNISATILESDVPAFIKDNKLSKEDGARQIRHRLMNETAAKINADRTATGHTADDQVETYLMRIIRGAGLEGLKSMRPKTGLLIRPLIDIWREETQAYCQSRKLKHREDETNLDPSYLRNRIRNELLPELNAKYNPSIKKDILRQIEVIGGDLEIISSLVEKAWPGIARVEGEAIVIDRDKLLEKPRAIKRHLIRRAISELQGDTAGITFQHIEDVINRVVAGKTGSSIMLPKGLIVKRQYDMIYLDYSSDSRLEEQAEAEPIPVSIPGLTRTDEPELILDAQIFIRQEIELTTAREKAFIDADRLGQNTVIRFSKEGDRFQPLGMTGLKKLKDFFIDCKIPRPLRKKAQVIESDGRIVWLVGYRLDERFKVTDETERVLVLSADRG